MDKDVRTLVPEAVFDDLRNSNRYLQNTRHITVGLVTCEYEWAIFCLVELRACAFC